MVGGGGPTEAEGGMLDGKLSICAVGAGAGGGAGLDPFSFSVKRTLTTPLK